MNTFLRILDAGRPYTWSVPKYLGATLINVVFSTIKITTLIPALQILFDDETLQSGGTKPAFEWTPIVWP